MNSFVGIDEEKWKPDLRGRSDGPEALRSALLQGLGAASMCWENIEKAGLFKPEDATRVGDGLFEWVESYIARRLEEA